jgi:hypothetical protein
VVTSVKYCGNGNFKVFAAPLGASASSEATGRLVVTIQSIVSTKSPLDVTSTAACDHNPRNVATVQASVELFYDHFLQIVFSKNSSAKIFFSKKKNF